MADVRPRRLIGVAIGGVLVACCSLTSLLEARADEAPSSVVITPKLGAGEATLLGEARSRGGLSASGSGQRQTRAPAVTTMRSSAPQVVRRLLPACSGNDANGGASDDCGATRAACPPGQLMFFVWQAPATDGVASGPFTQTGRVCRVPFQPGEPGAPDAVEALVLPVMTQADFQRLPLPAGRSGVEPASGEVLVAMPTNTYAVAEPVTLQTDLLGFPVTVRATPVAYSWDYGDGTVIGPTSEAGAPWPDLRVTHVYERAGEYAITLTTHYEGEYSVLGGPFLPVPGQAQVTSDPEPVVAFEGRTAPVADPLR